MAADDVLGGLLAGRHLVAGGHRRSAHVHGPDHPQQAQDRRTGLVRAVEESGLGADAIVDIAATRLDVGAGRDAGARLIGLQPRPTAVFCANDLLALGVMQASSTQASVSRTTWPSSAMTTSSSRKPASSP
ncbi:DNA-binding LacI/PurR family transcriptional regulator [Streptomyces candidus]|uniref:DNA-binding LacI/PurR family transcriptional regulator n=1 Tax=Streptomyces candidus TaxID=67283 RepID=A0A7X0HLV1_9ACTN|nr:DNA-binding LacI/PurR family transcriptional regulator [Streptomyces candidus]